jgi:hypothetical protein
LTGLLNLSIAHQNLYHVELIAEKTNFPEEALDEAANLLADGPTELEAFVS